MPINPGVIVSNGYTLTINGPVVGNPMHQWLSGFAAGEMTFGTIVTNIIPNWFQTNTIPGTTDMTTALKAAYDSVSSGNNLILLAQSYYFNSLLLWNKQVNVIGTDLQHTILYKNGNIVGIELATTGYAKFGNFSLTSGGSETSNGINITNGNRIFMSRIYVAGQGNHGIYLTNGILGHYENILTVNNGGDGFRVEDNYGFGGPGTMFCWANNFINMDTRGNTGWGFNLASGSANTGINIVSQQNTAGGINVDKAIQNNMEVYLESNTTSGLVLTANTTRNTVTLKQENSVAFSDSGSNNIIQGPGLTAVFINAMSRPKQGTNIAGRDLAISGGSGGSGATGVLGGNLQLYGGAADGTTGDADGGHVSIAGGDPVNLGSSGHISLQRWGGGISIGTINAPSISTLIDMSSTTRAPLFPRMTTTQRDALTPLNGMIIYNTTLNKFQGYEANVWGNLI